MGSQRTDVIVRIFEEFKMGLMNMTEKAKKGTMGMFILWCKPLPSSKLDIKKCS